MFAQFLYEQTSAEYEKHLLLIDEDQLEEKVHYSAFFEEKGHTVIRYTDDLHFRVEHDDAMTDNTGRYVILSAPGAYIPYDVQRRFKVYAVSLGRLFPKLNTPAIQGVNYDLLSTAYKRNFDDLRSADATEHFLREVVYGQDNIHRYVDALFVTLSNAVFSAVTYKDWFRVSNLKCEIDCWATKYDLAVHTECFDQSFLKFILSEFGKLSIEINATTPVLVSRAMEYMHDHSGKFAVIVMDGMSQFDWSILSESFASLKYSKSEACAMIPTTTSVSRQCLLSGKYPSQLVSPWTQSQEKNEFIDCALELGYTETQIGYGRGYDTEFASVVKCAAVIINDIDDMVHGQKQGRIGMLNDVSVLSKQEKLLMLVRRLLKQGFDVYITADHGNTPCVGTGKLVKTGVEVETKSRRMIVLKDFADKESIMNQREMIDYPKYYLKKELDYLICPPGKSFDAKDESVMSHGGITLDEVIVPFITVKAGENNG